MIWTTCPWSKPNFIRPEPVVGDGLSLDSIMLEGLDKINWSSLRCFIYGNASEVPSLLRTLANEKADDKKEAIEELGHSICLIREVTQSSQHVVPFLIELLDTGTTNDKIEILALLSELARSQPGVNGSARESDEARRSSIRLQNQQWTKATHQAVSSGCARFAQFLNSAEPDLRKWSAFLIGSICITEGASSLLRALPAEKNEFVKASLFLALSRLGSVECAEDAREALDSPSIIIRFAAAVTLARLFKVNAPKEAANALHQLSDMHDFLGQWDDSTVLPETLDLDPRDILDAAIDLIDGEAN